MRVEVAILQGLLKNQDYCKKVLPFLKSEYFNETGDKEVFDQIKNFVDRYSVPPTKDALVIEIGNKSGIDDNQFNSINDTINNIFDSEGDHNVEWLVDSTEEFCRNRSIYLGLMKSIEIANGKGGGLTWGAIPQILMDAVGVSFDPNVGHDYFDQHEDRFKYYHSKEEKIPFDLDDFNDITDGGVPRKTLNVAIAGPGVGKSLFMCHLASSFLSKGKNVLYITLELREEEIAKRIDANLMNVSMQDVHNLPKDIYYSKVESIKLKTDGRLIVKEYPTATAGTHHFRALLNELKIKKDFTPDVVFVDYINLCTSSRMKLGNNVSSYAYIKSIAEELRGMAVEYNIPLFSATQVNRSGYSSTDFGMESTSESFGLPATVDFMFALISTEELAKLGQIMVKQLKNRYNNMNTKMRFLLGVDAEKMRMYTLEKSAQEGLIENSKKSVSQDKSKFRSLEV